MVTANRDDGSRSFTSPSSLPSFLSFPLLISHFPLYHQIDVGPLGLKRGHVDLRGHVDPGGHGREPHDVVPL